MKCDRTFRFGLAAATSGAADQLLTAARRAEELGYYSLVMGDHYEQWRVLGPLTGMVAIANATTTLHTGTLVLNNELRNPVVLAKELATIDQLSGGRLEVGIGAGWHAGDFEITGVPMPRPGERIDRLREAVSIIKQAFADGPLSYSGDHYTVKEHDAVPKPVQRPHPPIVIGGGGPKVLTLAAQEADKICVSPSSAAGAIGAEMGESMTRDATLAKLELIRDVAGPRYDEIEIMNIIYRSAVTPDYEAVAAQFGAEMGMSAEEAMRAEVFLIGTPSMIEDEMQRRRELYDVSYYVLMDDAIDEFAPIVEMLTGK